MIKLIIVTIFYIVLVILANITANILIELPYITFALGTLFFGFIFTLRDLLHKYVGKRGIIKIIIFGTAVNAVAVAFSAFDIRVLLASVIAFFISEVIDTEIYQKLLLQPWRTRALFSNFISIPIDTVLFTIIAFAGVWSTSTIFFVVVGDIIIKYITATSIIYLKPNLSIKG